MGTITMMEERLQDDQGNIFSLSVVTDTESASDPDDGSIWISLTETTGGEYALVLDWQDYSEEWLRRRFLPVFLADPEYRQRFLSEEGSHYFGGELPDGTRKSSLPPIPKVQAEATESGGVLNQVAELLRKAQQGQARFADFARLRSGRDQWSSCKLSELREKAGEATAQALGGYRLEPEQEAVALRWVQRGLPLELAVRKVRTDQEIREKKTKSRTQKPKA